MLNSGGWIPYHSNKPLEPSLYQSQVQSYDPLPPPHVPYWIKQEAPKKGMDQVAQPKLSLPANASIL